MSKLSSVLSERIGAEKRRQKELAERFHARHCAIVGEAKALKWDTVQPKLSKLLAGDAEGERFFFDDADRLAAFAHAVGESVDRLNELRKVRTLLLDPRLAPEARAYLTSRAESPDARHWCADLERPEPQPGDTAADDGARIEAALNAEAEKHADCLLIVARSADGTFCKASGRAIAVAERHPRGWVIAGHSELVALPPPPPPRLWAGKTRMMPHPGQEHVVRAEMAQRKAERGRGGYHYGDETKHYEQLDARGETFTFDLLGLGTRGQLGGEHIAWFPPDPSAVCHEIMRQSPSRTVVWLHEDELFVCGSNSPFVHRALAPWHTAETVDLADIGSALRECNPWRNSPSTTDPRRTRMYSELEAPLRPRFGLTLERAVYACRLHAETQFADRWNGAIRTANADEVAERAAVIDRILAREFLLGPSDASSLFRLQRVRGAGILALPRSPRDILHVLADLGAGHLMRVQVFEFPKEDPLPFEWIDHALDGGDLRIHFHTLKDDLLLEGGGDVALRRRARARASDWDDDD